MIARTKPDDSEMMVDGRRCRVDTIRLLLVDGSEHELPRVAIPPGEKPPTLKASAWSLAQDMRRPERVRMWRQVLPARELPPRVIGAAVAV